MDQMQAEFAAMQPPVDIKILGINLTGLEASNASYCIGLSVPWLQDTSAQNVWGNWHANWRDVVILNKENEPIQVFNYVTNDLGNPATYAELKNALLAAAQAP
jgi:hypothetical protein